MTARKPWLPTSAAAELAFRSPPSVTAADQAEREPDSNPSEKIRSEGDGGVGVLVAVGVRDGVEVGVDVAEGMEVGVYMGDGVNEGVRVGVNVLLGIDRKSTRLNSSHPSISYAVFCLKK